MIELSGKRFCAPLMAVLILFHPGISDAAVKPEQIAEADSRFGFRLLNALVAEGPSGNVFMSPWSVASVLHLLSAGAAGDTLKELQTVLGTGPLDPEAAASACGNLNQRLGGQTNVTLEVANALWYRQGYRLNPAFVKLNETWYRSKLAPLEFAEHGAADVINHWAAQSTHGKIPQIVSPPLPNGLAMLAASAIYFKGTWNAPFDPKQTRPHAFTSASGQTSQLPMMYRHSAMGYQENDQFQAVQLPYSGNRLVMQIFLPTPKVTLKDFTKQLPAAAWQWQGQFETRQGTLLLPRFTVRYSANLNAALASLGLRRAFSRTADFSGLASGPLFLGEVAHESFVEVNEQGTEAAAVTGVPILTSAVRQEPPPFNMVVDRPFLCLILDTATHAVLFAGLIADPGAAGQ